VASDGSVYAAGYIFGTGAYNFGNGVTAAGTNSGGINTVLVKYNSSGTAQWAQTATAGNSNSIFFSVSVASDGSVYAVGYIDGTGAYTFGNGVTATGTYSGGNMVLVKYNSSGVALWAQTMIAGSGSSDFNGVSVASDGSVYAAGYIEGTGAYNLGNGVTATGTYIGGNMVLVKYNSSGVAQWAKTMIAGSSSSGFNGVSVALDGSVYAAGQIYGTGAYNLGNGVTVAGTYDSSNILLVGYF
jgi:outer membrane protein assembly factor BamB